MKIIWIIPSPDINKHEYRVKVLLKHTKLQEMSLSRNCWSICPPKWTKPTEMKTWNPGNRGFNARGNWKLPDSPVVRTQCFHCHDPGSIRGRGTIILKVTDVIHPRGSWIQELPGVMVVGEVPDSSHGKGQSASRRKMKWEVLWQSLCVRWEECYRALRLYGKT